MAIVFLRCKMWVIFLYIFTLSAVYSSPDYYKYNTHSSDWVQLVLKDDDFHSVHKRDTNVAKESIHTSSPWPPTTTESSTTEKQPIPVERLEPNNPKVNLTSQLNKNLGVNGTGQRKDVVKENKILTLNKNVTTSTTIKPDVITENSEPSTVNTSLVEGNVDDIAIAHHQDEILNKTAEETHANQTDVDNHEYYKSTFIVDPAVGEKHWVNMTGLPNVKINKLLSQSHRRAATVQLSFDFPFYGHMVRNVTIATGGFLYTGEYVHSWLAATQYIAPLMANFDTSLSNDSYIKYVDNGTAFTVEWERVCLQDKPKGGEFTFQATLHDNGDIVFVYKHVPVYIESIQDEHHPVKVGLSDAYIIDRTIFFVRRKTIYEYHRVNFNREDIKNWTVIYVSALPTCLTNTECHTCLRKIDSTFKCTWCPVLVRCSNGMDRHRQEWIENGCEREQYHRESQCTGVGGIEEPEEPDEDEEPAQKASRVTHADVVRLADKGVSVGVSGVLTILFIVALLAGLGMWVLYAYRNPHSASGQMLIRYRPSQWSWRRGEARYTAATIHM